MEHYRLLRGLVEKEARYESHLEFLSKCYKQGNVPKGLQFEVPIELDVDLDCLSKCSKIKRDCSLQMIGEILNGLEEKCSKLKDEILVCTRILKESSGQLYEEAIRRMIKWKEIEKQRVDKVKDIKWLKISKDRMDTDDKPTCTSRWKMVKITGDGNCFYRCISYHIYGNEEHHKEIRNRVIDHLELEKGKYQCYIDGNVYSHIQEQRCTDGRVS